MPECYCPINSRGSPAPIHFMHPSRCHAHLGPSASPLVTPSTTPAMIKAYVPHQASFSSRPSPLRPPRGWQTIRRITKTYWFSNLAYCWPLERILTGCRVRCSLAWNRGFPHGWAFFFVIGLVPFTTAWRLKRTVLARGGAARTLTLSLDSCFTLIYRKLSANFLNFIVAISIFINLVFHQ